MSYILESLTLEHDRMAEEYRIQPYGGDVVLFRASKQLNGLIADQYLGWRGLFTGNLDICEIPGHQQTFSPNPTWVISPRNSPQPAESCFPVSLGLRGGRGGRRGKRRE